MDIQEIIKAMATREQRIEVAGCIAFAIGFGALLILSAFAI